MHSKYIGFYSPLNNNLNGKRSSHDLSQRPCVPASFRQLFVCFFFPTLRACRRQNQKTRWFSFSFILERKGVFECLPKMGINNKSTCVFLESTYKWYPMIFVLLCLIYFTCMIISRWRVSLIVTGTGWALVFSPLGFGSESEHNSKFKLKKK